MKVAPTLELASVTNWHGRDLVPDSVTTRAWASLRAALPASLLVSTLAGCSILGTGTDPETADPGRATAVRPTTAEGPFPVTSVTDGDTIRVAIDGESIRVRLIGIDTPEISNPQKGVQCFGPEASRRAHELMDGTQVWLEYDPSQSRHDRYGRSLAYVWQGDAVLVNEKMVSEGFAHEYTYDNPYKYRETFRDAEQEARTAERGLWSPATCAGKTN